MNDHINEKSSEKSSVPPKNTAVDSYINEWPDSIKIIMVKIRFLVHATVPEVTEHMSWNMPTFKWQDKNLCHFAGNKAHLGFYPGPRAMEAFKEELTPFKTSKGAVQFRYEEEIPYELIERIIRIARDCIEEDLKSRSY